MFVHFSFGVKMSLYLFVLGEPHGSSFRKFFRLDDKMSLIFSASWGEGEEEVWEGPKNAFVILQAGLHD